MDMAHLLQSTRALHGSLVVELDDEPVVEVLEAHGQKYILVHPSKIFPFQALLHHSLVDGKPRAEFDSAAGGPHGKNGEPSLRVDVNDGDAWEDEERWPPLPNFESTPDDIELNVRYLSPDRARLSKMWSMCAFPAPGSQRPDLLLVYREPEGTMHALDVVGFGSKFGGWNENKEYVGDIHVEQVVAAMLVGGE